MTRFRKLDQLKRLLPGAATILTLSLAVTLRVERSCSERPIPNPGSAPSVLYSYPEILFANSAARPRWLALEFRAPQFVGPARDVTGALLRE